MPKHTPPNKTWLQMAFIIAFATLGVSPFLLGGNRAPFEAGFALSSWLAVGCLLVHLKNRKNKQIEIPFWGPIILTLFLGAISLWPWPENLFAQSYPLQHKLINYLKGILSTPLQHDLVFRSSMGPAFTAQGMLRWIATLMLLMVFARFHQKSERRKYFFRFMGVLSVAVFLTALFHQILHQELIMGLEPGGPDSFFYAPLRNANHLAKLFGIFVFFNLFAQSKTNFRGWKFFFQGSAALCVLGVFFTQSRGAILFLLVGLFCLIIVNKTQKDTNDTAPAPRLYAQIVFLSLLAILGMGLYLVSSHLETEVQATLDDGIGALKIEVWMLVLKFITDHPIWGAGLNALSGGLPQYYTMDSALSAFWGQHRIHYAENIILDLFGAFGLLGGCCLLGTWVQSLARLFKIKEPISNPIPIIGFFFVIGSELTDYALVNPCILWPTLLLLVMLFAPTNTFTRFSLKKVFICWVLLGPILFYLISIAVPADRKKLDIDLLVPGSVEIPRLMDVQKYHPFDANLSFEIAAQHRSQNEFAQALKWANYAMLIWPTSHGAHMEAARSLVFLGKQKQSMLEYKLALKVAPSLIHTILDDFKKLNINKQLRINAIPDKQPMSLYHLCVSLHISPSLAEERRCSLRLLNEPDGENYHYNYALTYLIQNGPLEKARSWLKTTRAKQLEDGEFQMHQMSILAKNKGAEEALATATRTMSQLKKPMMVALWALNLCIKQKKFHAHCQKIIALLEKQYLPRNQKKHFQWLRFIFYKRSNNWALAYKQILGLSQREQKNLDFQKQLIDTEIYLGFEKKARQNLRRISHQLSKEAIQDYERKLLQLTNKKQNDRLQNTNP